MEPSTSSCVLKLSREELVKANEKKTAEDFICHVCGLCFGNVGSKYMHLTKKHGIIQKDADIRMQKRISSKTRPLKLFECSDCSKTFTSMKLVVQHFKKVHGEREFSCVLCLKSFAYERDLKYHSANKCNGQPKIIVPPKRPRKRRKTVEKPAAELVKPGMKSVEIQTDPMEAILMMDTGSQVFVQPEYYGIDQQQQTHFDLPVATAVGEPYEPYPTYSVHQNTQTYHQTNTIGTTTTVWEDYSMDFAENGTQTWVYEEYPQMGQQRQMIDGYSMTEDQFFPM
uniref:C2H2-type domain-containing protein n=1 Tax=Panagrolaimus sp. JU765 TaxID=591449 RepID=A0AC34QGR3_9BILA